MAEEQLTSGEIKKIRDILKTVTVFPWTVDPGDSSGGDVRMVPGLGASGKPDGEVVISSRRSNPVIIRFVDIDAEGEETELFTLSSGVEPPSQDAGLGSVYIRRNKKPDIYMYGENGWGRVSVGPYPQ